MRKKLTRTGNSLALILDKRLLDRVGIDAETPLDVSTNGQVIVVSPVRDRRRTAKLKRIVADQALNLQVVKDLLGKKW